MVIKLGWFKPTLEELRERIRQVDGLLISRALEKNMITSEEEAVIRDLKPTDIGLENNVWVETISTANNWNRISGTEQQVTDKIIVIYGIANLAANPLATGIKLTKGANDKTVLAEIFFEPLYLMEEPIALFEENYIYEDEDYIGIFEYAKGTGTDNLVILGRVIETREKSPVS